MRARAARPGGDDTITIGELSQRAGVSPRTVRYYEEIGILPPPARTDGGTRRYPADHVVYVRGACLLKEMGFSLDEIAGLTGAGRRGQALLGDRLAELERQIRLLGRLHELVAEAAGDRRPGATALRAWLSELT